MVVAKEFKADANHKTVSIKEFPEGFMGLDIGKRAVHNLLMLLKKSKTIVWNGPMGVFEIEAFSNGTREIAKALAKFSTTIIGGETLGRRLNYSDLQRK